jgi:hypothetical protein
MGNVAAVVSFPAAGAFFSAGGEEPSSDLAFGESGRLATTSLG